MSQIHDVIALLILIFFSAFFSASETALVNMNKIKLKHLVKENIKNADILESLYADSDKLIGAILIGNNLVNVSASSITTTIAASKFSNAGIGIAVGVTTLMILVFGEITPKNFALENSERISLFIAPFMKLLVSVFSPILFVLNIISSFISKILGLDNLSKQPLITQDELKTIVDVSNQEGVLKVDETEMIQNIFEFKDLTIENIMIQRRDIVAIEKGSSYDEIIKVFKEKKLSRIPVYEDTIDEIVGFLYAKDLFFDVLDKNSFDMEKIIRKPIFVNEFVKISDFFKKMQQNKTHIAIVLDEYGGVAGIVTMENLIEEIVGDIYDEYDNKDEEIKKLNDSSYIINANSKLEDIEEEIGIKLESDDYESLGGYIIDMLGEIPRQGQIIEDDKHKFIIVSMDRNRINKVKIIIKKVN